MRKKQKLTWNKCGAELIYPDRRRYGYHVWPPDMKCVTRKHSKYEKVLRLPYVDFLPDTHVRARWHALDVCLT
jgi:hypothetical protein